MSRIEKTADEIKATYSVIASVPFPYKDCYRLQEEHADEDFEGLIPDLDVYFYEVASPAIGIRQVMKWTASRASESRTKLSRSFFEIHPQYESLRPHITPEATPMLHRHIETTELVRHLLLDLLAQIEAREAIVNT